MKTILAAVDLSKATARVVSVATGLADRHGTELVLLHVAAPDPDFVGYAAGPQSVRDQLAEHYHREHRELQDLETGITEGGTACRSLLIQGGTVDKILAECDALDAAFLVMGSHGHGALHNLLVGSVTEGVLRGAAIPVVVVPCRAD